MNDIIKNILETHSLNYYNMIFRLLLSFIIGAMVGFERGYKKQTAGLRTHIIISVGACLIMLLSIYISTAFSNKIGDPARIAAQVISGIGFLGAGVIMRMGLNVKGITTAATIWVVAGLGLAIGVGMYIISGVTAVILLLTLSFKDLVWRKIFPGKSFKILQIGLKSDKILSDLIVEKLKKFDIKIQSMDIEQSFAESKSKLKFIIQINKTFDINAFYKEMQKTKQINNINLKDFD